jgi:hypothetical protein
VLKADFYSAPFFAPNDQVAIRDFHKLVYVSNAIAPAYASDFILYEVGSFNSDTGLFDSLSTIALVIEGQKRNGSKYEHCP